MKNNSTKKFVFLTLMSAMAITLNIFESNFIPPLPFGIRIGLANIIALITINILGIKEMLIVNIMRVVIGSLLRGLIFGSTFWIALGGIILSSISLILLYKLKSSLIFSSVICSISHCIGQVFVVVFLYNQFMMFAIVPYLLIGSIPVGVVTGIVSKEALRLINKNMKF